jgi:hypothetical protein
LSVTERYFVIGVSEMSERSERPKSKGYLALIDKKTLSLVKLIDLNRVTYPQNLGNINEVRCLSEYDFSQSITKSTLLNVTPYFNNKDAIIGRQPNL